MHSILDNGAARRLIGALRPSRFADRVRTPADAPLGVLLLMLIMSLLASADLAASMVGFWRLALGVAIFFALTNGFPNPSGLRRLDWVFVLAGAGFTVLAIFGTRWEVVRILSLPALYDRLPVLLHDPEDGLGVHPRVVGMALGALAPVLVSLAFLGKGKAMRPAAGSVAAAMLIVLPLTQSLGAVFGVGLALIFMACVRSRNARFACAGAGFFAATIAAWAAGQREIQNAIGNMLSPQNTLGVALDLRLDMWGRALAMLHDMPYTGIGLDSFPVIQTNFYPGYLLGPEPHAHNLFLQVALDLGLPGLGAFLWLLVAAGFMARRSYAGHPEGDIRALVLGCAGGILSYLGSGLIDTLWQPKSGILLWLLIGGIAAAYASGTRELERPGPSMRRSPFEVLRLPAVLLGLSVLVVLIDPGIWKRNVGVLLAHKAVFAARQDGRVSPQTSALAERYLGDAAAAGLADAHVFALLGSLRAWRGDTAGALQSFERQVALDGANPAAVYEPYEALRRRLVRQADPAPWSDLARVYNQWMTRYPERAENYVAAAVCARYQQDAAAAGRILTAGIESGARPGQVLQVALAELGQAP